MPERFVHARLKRLEPGWRVIRQAEVDMEKVQTLRALIRAGAPLPPAVVAEYKDHYLMPLDGHHRQTAYELEGVGREAWVISGAKYELMCMLYRGAEAEAHVLCDGVPAMEVADRWRRNALTTNLAGATG